MYKVLILTLIRAFCRYVTKAVSLTFDFLFIPVKYDAELNIKMQFLKFHKYRRLHYFLNWGFLETTKQSPVLI